MWKKVLYIGVAAVIGIMVFLLGYQSNQINHLTSLVNNAIDSGKYEEVAKISNTGEIKFLSEGTSIIETSSEKYVDIKDSFQVTVSKVNLENISSKILNAEVDENGIYTLLINKIYTISTSFTPSNTTE